jgi:mono/diheme cytochrome c family protein
LPNSKFPLARRIVGGCLLAAAVFATGCRQDMHDQPRYKPYAATDFFGDRRSARTPVAGTIARGHLREDTHFYFGKVNDAFARELPMPVTRELLARGRDRFNIYCSPCHGRTGTGEGMVVQRGFKQPPSYHEARLREEPVGYFFDVMTNGFGAMISYASRVSVEDRWAIAAYIRVLQYSQNATIEDVPAEQRQELAGMGQ